MRAISFSCALILSSCSVNPAADSPGAASESAIVTLDCKDGWGGCYNQAKQICGGREFDELDRLERGTMTAAGRPEQRDSSTQIYREDPRIDVSDRVLTIRCK